MNLVCICLDTLRADVAGDGEKLDSIETPNLDFLIEHGVRFEKAYGEGQPTIQARRAFFTGKRSFPWRFDCDRRGMWPGMPGWHKIPPEQDTLAEKLLKRGYMTGLISDCWHLFMPTCNFTRGFVNWDFIRGQEWDNWRGGSPATVENLVEEYTDWDIRNINDPRLGYYIQYLLNRRDWKREEDYFCAKVASHGAQWIEDNIDNQPFFLWLGFFDPHEPWDPPREYADKYLPHYEGKDPIFGCPPDADPEVKERLKALYFGEVTFTDKWLGYFLNKLEDLGIFDDTLIIVLSDHGTQLGEHGYFGKGFGLHSYDTRITWVLRHPQGPKGKTISSFVQSHDVMPTVLGLLDIPFERRDITLDGEDVWPLVIGEQTEVRDHVVIGWPRDASVRDNEWNYVVAYAALKDPNAALYHLPEDPEEMNNVIDEYQEVAAKHRSRLEKAMGQALPADFPNKPVEDFPVFQYYKCRYLGR